MLHFSANIMQHFPGQRKKVPGESINSVKLPTPVANNHAAAAALAVGNNNIELFDDEEDDDSLPDEYVSTLKLNVLIGLVVLLVVTAVGTAMLLSISKIWGNHQDNVWISDPVKQQWVIFFLTFWSNFSIIFFFIID